MPTDRYLIEWFGFGLYRFREYRALALIQRVKQAWIGALWAGTDHDGEALVTWP